jgi:drug/metabolite transporter (DMT)-like permease
MPPRLSLSISDWLLIVALSMAWGGSFVFAEVALTELPPLTVALGRVGIAAVILALVVVLVGETLPRGRELRTGIAVMALLNNVIPFALILWGQLHVTAGLASILVATAPLFAVVVAHLATDDEKITPARLIGLLAGFAGVVVMIGPEVLGGLASDAAGPLAVLLGAFLYAASGVYGRRFRGERPLVLATGQMTAATIMLLPLAALVDRPWTYAMPSPAALGALAAMGAVSSALGFVIFFRVLARAGATNLMLVNFLNPVSAIVLGALLIGEHITPRQMIGMAAIALGLAAIDGRPARFIVAKLGRAQQTKRRRIP